jgi:hypothetical protein
MPSELVAHSDGEFLFVVESHGALAARARRYAVNPACSTGS